MLGRGVNDLPWEKKGLPGGPEVGGGTIQKFSLHFKITFH